MNRQRGAESQLSIELEVCSQIRVGDALRFRERRGKIGGKLGKRQPLTGPVRGQHPEMERLLRFPSAAVVVCDQRRFAFPRGVRLRFKVMGDLLVQRLTPGSRKTFVGCFLNEGMVETVTRFTIAPRLEDQAGFT